MDLREKTKKLDIFLSKMGFKLVNCHSTAKRSFRNYEDLEKDLAIHIEIGKTPEIFDLPVK